MAKKSVKLGVPASGNGNGTKSQESTQVMRVERGDENPGPTWMLQGGVMLLAPSAQVRSTQGGDVRSAVRLLGAVAEKLRTRQQLELVEADFLAEALEAAIQDPANAAKAFGLVAKRGGPRRGGVARVLAGKAVADMVTGGVPLKDGRATETWDGNGAYSRVASARSMSVDQVKRGYTKFLADRAVFAGHRLVEGRRT